MQIDILGQIMPNFKSWLLKISWDTSMEKKIIKIVPIDIDLLQYFHYLTSLLERIWSWCLVGFLRAKHRLQIYSILL